jgi:hypothetical protein
VKTNIVVGSILIAIGVASFALPGITYVTREKAMDIGPIQVTTEKRLQIPLLPIVGGVTIFGGMLVLAMAWRSSSHASPPRP